MGEIWGQQIWAQLNPSILIHFIHFYNSESHPIYPYSSMLSTFILIYPYSSNYFYFITFNWFLSNHPIQLESCWSFIRYRTIHLTSRGRYKWGWVKWKWFTGVGAIDAPASNKMNIWHMNNPLVAIYNKLWDVSWFKFPILLFSQLK